MLYREEALDVARRHQVFVMTLQRHRRLESEDIKARTTGFLTQRHGVHNEDSV